MPQVKMLRDWKTRKEGDIWSPSESTAKQLIASGIAAAFTTAIVVDRSADPEPPPVVSETSPVVSESSPVIPEPSPAISETEPMVSETHQEPSTKNQEPSTQEPPLPSRYAQHRSWIKKD